VLAFEAVSLSRERLAVIAGLVILACVVALSASRLITPPVVSQAPRASSPSGLDRLPARPEDIEAHGEAAETILSPDDARRANAAVPFVAGPLDAARPFSFKGSAADRAQALKCLSTAVLYEAGDDTTGEAAVAQVVLNRVRHAAFPATVCGVVYQGAERATGCQFSFTCDGSLRRAMPQAAWDRARTVAERALDGKVDASVGLATHYHTDWVYPYWSPSLRKLARVGTHLFFGWPGSWGGPLAFARTYRGGEPAVGVPTADTMPVVVEAAPPGAPGGEDSAIPGLGGFRVVPARLPPDMAHVPLYGNKLRLIRADGRAFGLLTTSQTTAAKLVDAALALCANPGFCVVQAWSNEDDIPGAYPIPAATRATMVFEYVRDGAAGKGTTHFDCERFPNRNPQLCLGAAE
jgi:spore germination cell wall hydrolase CwlJ-like protein